MRHRGKKAERIRIREFAVFLEALPQITTLHVMKATGVPAVVTRKDAPLRVDLTTERVAATLGKHFETVRLRLISPDALSEHVRNGSGIEAGTYEIGGYR